MIARLAGLALAGVMVAGVMVAGCSSDTAALPDPPTGGYRIAIEAEAPTGDTIEVSGTTNLPDRTKVDLSATRNTVDENETAARGVTLGRATATVDGGEFSASIELDNDELLVTIMPGYEIEEISPDVSVCAEVRTGLDDFYRQPDEDVNEALGESGEQLEGAEDATEFGELTDTPSTWLSVQRDVEVAPPLDEIGDAQDTLPKVAEIDSFCI